MVVKMVVEAESESENLGAKLKAKYFVTKYLIKNKAEMRS